MTKQELRQYRDIDRELKQIESKIDRLRGEIESPRTSNLTGMPRGGGGQDYYESRLDKLKKLDDIYNAKWDQLIDLQKGIELLIEGLEPRLRVLMRSRYIDGDTFEQIAVNTNRSWRHTIRLHGEALRKIKFS